MDERTCELMFSSESDEHETPDWLFDSLNEEFGFTLDACATAANAKLPNYISPERDGLLQYWEKSTFVNPPYSKAEKPCKPNCKKKRCQKRGWHRKKRKPGCIDWVRKAYWEARAGMRVVMLLPARTDTKYFHRYIWDKKRCQPRPGVEVRFLEGRLKFKNCKDAAPFPSMIVIFNPWRRSWQF